MTDFEEIRQFSELADEMMDTASLGIRPGLARLSRLVAALGNPQRGVPAIHVLGTNGKGSTVAMMSAICARAGLKTASYTSPHLVSLRERVCVDGRFLPIGDWRDALRRVSAAAAEDPALRETPPTFFEMLTAIAMLMIREARVDVAIMEAGMGGRYDATMLCDALATVITPIGMDHMEYLGDTLTAIAGEKFAAVRPGTDAFYAADAPSLRGQFLRLCQSRGAIAHCLADMADVRDIRLSLAGTEFTLSSKEDGERSFTTPLIGTHQAYNAGRVVSVFRVLREKHALFAAADAAAVRSGLACTRWPGRVEVLKDRGSRVTILDGAHNEHGMRALISTMDSLVAVGAAPPVGAVVFGVMREKELAPLLNLLKPLNCPIFATEAPIRRALPSRELASAVAAAGMQSAGAWENASEALEAAEAHTPGTVLCCGSLYLVGAIKKELAHYA